MEESVLDEKMARAKKSTSLVLIFFTSLYFLLFLFSEITLTGFWTDVIVAVLLVTMNWLNVFKQGKSSKKIIFNLSIIISISATTICLGIAAKFLNPWNWGSIKTRSFCFQQIKGRLFNAYFTPVGAYSGGEGQFWISESPLYCPLIEIEIYYDRTVDWDFRNEEWDGQKIDQNEVVRAYIMEHILAEGL